MFITGFCLSTARVAVDPYHRHVIKSYIWEWFGVILMEPDEGLVAQPLNTYLAESLNLELINIILQGVTMLANKNYDAQKEKDNGLNFYKDKL